MLKLLSVIATVLAIPVMANATSYYVAPTGSDSNSGSQSAPFASITKAASVSNAGDTVDVVSGSYAFAPFVTAPGSVTYQCTNSTGTLARHTCKLQPANGTTNSQTLWENDGGGVVIDGFDVDGRTPDGTASVRIAMYSSPTTTLPVTYQHNHVHYVYQHTCANDGGAAIYGDAWNAVGAIVNFVGNTTDHVGIAPCNTVHGLYFGTKGDAFNNISYKNAGWGITTWHDAYANHIVNNTSFANGGGGISVGNDGGYHSSPPWSGSIVNNISYSNGGYGIVVGGGGYVAAGQTFTNNLTNGNPTNFLNNSSVAGSCVNCVTLAPVFVNYNPGGTGDYHLVAGSPGIDQGTSSGAPTTDFDGKPRPSGAGFDIGAYEYGSTSSTTVTCTLTLPQVKTTVGGTATSVTGTLACQ
jgi:hypothetical protein